MKVKRTAPPRSFAVGKAGDITLTECAKISLAPDELVTFVTEDGAQHDVARKDWGFYATQSLNGRLPSCGLIPFLVHGSGKYFVVLVESAKIDIFESYLKRDGLTAVARLDNARDLITIHNALSDA